MKKIIAIIGARPQFIKHYPIDLASKNKIQLKSIHTGQHYDANMSQVFFDQFGMSHPDYMLEVGSKSHAEQTAYMMIEIEKILLKENPDGVIVYGDTNSTLAGAIVASKLNIPIYHIEAGLRSYNMTMPEEVNRVLTDHVSSLLFIPSEASKLNLEKEGISKNVFNVGDIMKDLILRSKSNLSRPIIEKYYYATIHRPYNTDDIERLKYLLNTFEELDNVVVLSRHPRTKSMMDRYQLLDSDYKRLRFIEPQSYLTNLSWLKHAEALLTDSGGMQKEAYWLEKKCITVRTETEWVETLEGGANHLVFDDLSKIRDLLKVEVQFDKTLYGDGNASTKIIDIIKES